MLWFQRLKEATHENLPPAEEESPVKSIKFRFGIELNEMRQGVLEFLLLANLSQQATVQVGTDGTVAFSEPNGEEVTMSGFAITPQNIHLVITNALRQLLGNDIVLPPFESGGLAGLETTLIECREQLITAIDERKAELNVVSFCAGKQLDPFPDPSVGSRAAKTDPGSYAIHDDNQ